MTRVSSSNSPESIAIRQYGPDNKTATQPQRDLAGAAADVKAMTDGVNGSYGILQNLLKTGAPSSQIEAQKQGLEKNLGTLHDLEKAFWSQKVNEDQNWVKSGGGADAEAALKADQGALNNFNNADYVQDIEIPQKDGSTQTTNSIKDAVNLASTLNS